MTGANKVITHQTENRIGDCCETEISLCQSSWELLLKRWNFLSAGVFVIHGGPQTVCQQGNSGRGWLHQRPTKAVPLNTMIAAQLQGLLEVKFNLTANDTSIILT